MLLSPMSPSRVPASRKVEDNGARHIGHSFDLLTIFNMHASQVTACMHGRKPTSGCFSRQTTQWLNDSSISCCLSRRVRCLCRGLWLPGTAILLLVAACRFFWPVRACRSWPVFDLDGLLPADAAVPGLQEFAVLSDNFPWSGCVLC